MKDDLWVAKYTAELVTNKLLRGTRLADEADLLKEREFDIFCMFAKRFGANRANHLMFTINNEINNF